jgi:ATP-dependent Clp protease, protease subunit
LPIITRNRAGPEASAMPSVPFVIEREGREERVYDLYSRLLKDRIIFLQGEVDDDSTSLLVGQMLFLQIEDPKADIHLFINSPGGSVTAGMSVFDMMRFVTCDVATYCIGMAASMGATLLAAGTKGKRFALPHAEVMIHQVLGGARGAATDIAIRTAHLLRTKKTMNELLAKMTGQPLERVEKDTDRDNFMSAQEAKEYGLVDHVLERIPAGLVAARALPQ